MINLWYIKFYVLEANAVFALGMGYYINVGEIIKRKFWLWGLVAILPILLYFWLTPYFNGSRLVNPALIHLGPITIYWYGLFMALAVVIGWWMFSKRLAKIIPAVHIANVLIMVTLLGVIGARLAFVLLKWLDFSDNLWLIFNLQSGGMSIHGAILGGLLAISWYCWKYKLSLLQIADAIIVPLIVGQIIGRFGNFFNQEAFGPPTHLPWKMFVAPIFRPQGLESFSFFHPTFLYEILALCGLLIFIIWLENHYKKSAGSLVLSYVIGYSIIRFGIEWFRVDSDHWGSLSIAQWFSVLAIMITIIISLILRYQSFAYVNRSHHN